MIQIQSLSCHYGDKAVLDTVTLELSEARVAVVGRNGSGKSTLAKAISGLIRPGQGRILINGVDVLKDRKAVLSAVGILFQNPDHQIISRPLKKKYPSDCDRSAVRNRTRQKKRPIFWLILANRIGQSGLFRP